MSTIPLSQPDITAAEVRAVTDALQSGRLSNGPRVADFEELVADRTGRRHAVATNSGTSALQLVLRALDIGPEDEVITTPFSFIASANCILQVGARPVFVDIDPRSLNMDPTRVERAISPKTKAILAVEVFGNPTHMDSLAQIAQHHEIPLIEDSCEGLGGRYRGTPIGAFGRAGVFGFYTNKQITTGEGGMIVTDDDRLARRAQMMRNHGRTPAPGPSAGMAQPPGSWLQHECLGYSYRLSELAAALGIAQMERLDELLKSRREVANLYMQRLMDWQDLILPTVEQPRDMSWFIFVVRLSDEYTQIERDRIMQGMHRHEIGAGNYFPCIHLQPFYRDVLGTKRGEYPVAESVSTRTIALPFFTPMDETQVELVCHTLKVMLQREQLLRR